MDRCSVWKSNEDAVGCGIVFVHGVEGPRKWMVQPEPTMARVLGTKVRGAVVFATFYFYLVPSHAQLGLFLAETPVVSAFVAPLSLPSVGCSQSRLEWFDRYLWVHQ